MSKEYQINEKSRRILMVIFKAVAGLLALGFSIWLAWYEFGTELLFSKTFIFMMFMWLILGLTFFFHQLDEATQKTTNEKIDELIEEIRGLREDVKSNRK